MDLLFAPASPASSLMPTCLKHALSLCNLTPKNHNIHLISSPDPHPSSSMCISFSLALIHLCYLCDGSDDGKQPSPGRAGHFAFSRRRGRKEEAVEKAPLLSPNDQPASLEGKRRTRQAGIGLGLFRSGRHHPSISSTSLVYLILETCSNMLAAQHIMQ